MIDVARAEADQAAAGAYRQPAVRVDTGRRPGHRAAAGQGDRHPLADGCGLRPEYLRYSATVGQRVTVTLPAGGSVSGTATGVDPDGRLAVRTGSGLVRLSAGDVDHVR